MSKSISDEDFFRNPNIKKEVIKHLIKGISAAKGKTGKIVATEEEVGFKLWQTNLGQYLGYLTNNPNVNRPDLFNLLFSIYKQKNPRSDPSVVFEYSRKYCSTPEGLAINYQLSDEDKNKLNELNHFLSKDDIKEILKKTECSQEDLENKEFFKLFLGSLEEAEKRFIYDSVTLNISDNDAGYLLKKQPLDQKDIVTLSAYGLSEASPSSAIPKSNSFASASLQAKKSEEVKKDSKLAPNNSPPTDSQIAFQNAVKDVFYSASPASPQARAKLRDRLAEKALPDWMSDALKDSSQQLDGAEFITFLLDAIVPDKNKLTDVTKITWEDRESNRPEKQAKLELPFKRKNKSAATKSIIKCSEMLDAYSEIENLDGENQYDAGFGQKVDAKLSHRPKTDNPDLDIVVSLRRHASRKTNKTRKNSKNEDIPVTEQYRIDDSVDLDIIALDTASGKKQKYEATSFIVHRGGINGGHYVTYVKEKKSNGSIVWACYDDSSRTETTGDALPNESKQAYTVKFSPLVDNYQLKTGASRYKTALPASQGCGTINGGVRCWANAAFAFALSITSLHEKNHKRAPDPAIANPIIASASAKFNSLTGDEKITEPVVSELIGFDNIKADPDGKSLSRVIEKLQIIKGLNLEEGGTTAGKKIDERLQELDYPTAKVILQNSVLKYLIQLTEKQDDKKTNEILGLHEFFSDENNSENTLKIIEQIKVKKKEFIDNPQEFCAQIISSTNNPTEEQKNKFQPEAPLFVTSQDLCYKAIDEGDQEKLKKLLPHAIKLDKDFLTNALCYAVLNNKDSITATLINDYKADPKKTSTLYEETAEKIANNLDKTLPQPKIKTSVSKDKILIRDDKIKVLAGVLAASVNEAKKATKCTLSSEKCLTEFGQKNLGEFLGYIRDLKIKDDAGNEPFSEEELKNSVNRLSLDDKTLDDPQFFHNFLLEFHKQRALAESKTNQNLVTFKEGNVPGNHQAFEEDVTGETKKGGIDFHYSEAIGNRSSQEDSFIIGEGKNNWPSAEAPHLMEKAFNELGEKIRKYCSNKKSEAGSTALLTHYSTDQKLTIANLGDSRAVLFIKKSDGSFDWIRLTNDQEPDDILEKARIEKNGGSVSDAKNNDFPRVKNIYDQPSLSVARSFGDTKFEGVLEGTGNDGYTYFSTNNKKLISYKPDIYQYDIRKILAEQGEGAEVFLLNSCDGLYDYGKGNETTYAEALKNWSNNENDLQEKWGCNIAEYLRDYALALGSKDNITVCFSNITEAPSKSVFNGVFDGHDGKIVSSIAAKVLKDQLLTPDSIIHSPIEGVGLANINLDNHDIINSAYPYEPEDNLYPKAEPVRVAENPAKIERKNTQGVYAYNDLDIDAVNRARNKRDGISYFKNSKGQESGILLKDEKPLTGNGAKTTIELPACDLFQGSSIGSHLKAQLENFKEFSKNQKPLDLYPVKILFPYKTDCWNWKVGEITVIKSGDNLSLKGCAYDSVNKEASLDSGIWDEISKTFKESFSDKRFNTLTNLKITYIDTPQKGEIASGLYAARAMHNLKTNSNKRNVWNDTSGEESDLRSEDSALVTRYNPKSNFCAPLNAGGFVDIFQTIKSEKSPNNQLGSETDSTKTADQQTTNLEKLTHEQLRVGSESLGTFLLKKAKNEAPSSKNLFDDLGSNPLREIIFTNYNKDEIKPDDHLLNLVREANLIYTKKKLTDIADTLTSPETEKKRKYQDCIDIISGSYANSLRQLVISSRYNHGEKEEEKEKIKALGIETISIIKKTLPGEKEDVLKVLEDEVKIAHATIWSEVQLARKSSIEEMQKGLIAMMKKEKKQDSNEKNEATLKTVSLIEKFAESNNPILTKDTKNYTPLEAAKEKIGEAKKELLEANKELKKAFEDSADTLGKAKAAFKLKRINSIFKKQERKHDEYNEQEILEYSAKGILSKALKVSIIEEIAKTDGGKNTISETIAEPKLYERYARKNFIGDENDKIKFENEKFEGNSFANCTFKNCDFSATDNKTMHFVNCTFGEGCVLPQNLKNQKGNFLGCKFSEEIFNGITEEEKKNLKENLEISVSEVASGNF